jgi:hypothetical protein
MEGGVKVTFAPEDAASGVAVEGLEARIVSYDGVATPERSWTGPVTYYLVPGTYRVSLKADGYFDCVSTFQVEADSPSTLPLPLRSKTVLTLGKEQLEVDALPEATLAQWRQHCGGDKPKGDKGGDLDLVVCLQVRLRDRARMCVFHSSQARRSR